MKQEAGSVAARSLFIVAVIASLLFFGLSQYWGLVKAPPDQMMGDVYRILFVHVPAAWNAFLCFFVSFIACILYLIRRTAHWDRLAHSTIEVGVVLTGLTLILGSIWGKPTWGVWWTWDPRLTTTALLFILYCGYLMLRRLLPDPVRRARLSAAVGTFIFLNVPIVYFSVKWWRSLHQVQSSPETMAPEMVLALRMNAIAILAVATLFVISRVRLAKRETVIEEWEATPPRLQ